MDAAEVDSPEPEPEPESGPDQDYDAREEHMAKGHRPEDVGGTEDTAPRADREHPGDTPGGA